MNKLEKIAVAGIAGTSFMTLFSYLVSVIEKENFSEPEHLGTLIHRLLPGTKKLNQAQGWVAHYAVGWLFATAFIELWERKKLKPSLKNALLLGGISGALAVGVWKLTFKIHPAPPWIRYTKYYTQLVPAHIVFALFATINYRLIQRMEKRTFTKKLATITNEDKSY
jgi:hypothetical protein